MATVANLQAEGILLVEDGNHGEYRPRPDEFVHDGVAFIRAADMDAGRVDFDAASHINDRARRRITKGIGAPGDVLLSHKGTVGKVAIVPGDAPPFVCSPQTTFWRTLRPEVLDRGYLYAYLRSRPFHEQLAARAGETDMAPYVSLTSQRGLAVVVPPIEDQRRVAGILGSLDDKIELNRRIGETLQAIAETLFRSWFVDFDPVRAKAEGRDPGLPADLAEEFPDEFEDSGIGETPSGWRRATLGDVAVHQRRAVQPNELDPSSPYIGLEHMPRKSVALAKWETAGSVQSGKTAFRRGEILFGKLRPYFHKVGVAPTDGVCSTDIVVVAPRGDAWFGFVLGHLSSDAFVDYTNAGSTGTKMPRTSWAEMARYPVTLPTDPVAAAFTARVRPMVERMIAGIHENRTLVAVRDSLLPRLVSGDLRAPEILTDREQVSP